MANTWHACEHPNPCTHCRHHSPATAFSSLNEDWNSESFSPCTPAATPNLGQAPPNPRTRSRIMLGPSGPGSLLSLALRSSEKRVLQTLQAVAVKFLKGYDIWLQASSPGCPHACPSLFDNTGPSPPPSESSLLVCEPMVTRCNGRPQQRRRL